MERGDRSQAGRLFLLGDVYRRSGCACGVEALAPYCLGLPLVRVSARQIRLKPDLHFKVAL